MSAPYLEPVWALSLPLALSFDLGKGEDVRLAFLRLLVDEVEGESSLSRRFPAPSSFFFPVTRRFVLFLALPVVSLDSEEDSLDDDDVSDSDSEVML